MNAEQVGNTPIYAREPAVRLRKTRKSVIMVKIENFCRKG